MTGPKGEVASRLRARRSKELPGRIDRVGGRSPVANRLLLGFVLAALLGAMMVDWTPHAGTAGLTEGDIAPTDVRAHRSFAVEDAALTGERRAAAREAVAPSFVHDVLIGPDIQRRIDRAFDEMRGFLEEAKAAGTRAVDPTPAAAAADEDPPLTGTPRWTRQRHPRTTRTRGRSSTLRR